MLSIPMPIRVRLVFRIQMALMRTGLPQIGTDYKGGGNYFFFNFAAFTPALPPGDRQVYYGSFTRDICDKYLTIFGDFKYARSYFDASLAAVPFTPDPFKTQAPMHSLVLRASVYQLPIRSIRSLLQTRRFQTSFLTDMVSQSRPVFASAASRTPAHDTKNSLTGISCSTSECAVNWAYVGDYFKTWNWELGFRYSRNEGQDLSVGEVSQPGLREALLDTNPATAFNPFLGLNGMNSAQARGAGLCDAA